MLKNFRTYNLSVEFYQLGKKIDLPIHLRDQFLRAASSITLNLAEGSAKPTRKDQNRFYYIAMGSLRECESILDLSGHNRPDLTDKLNHLGASIHKLTKF